MTALDTAEKYQTSMFGVVSDIFDAEWVASFARSEMTETRTYDLELLCGSVVGETTCGSHDETVLSGWETSPIGQLLAKLVAFQQTTEDERWPGATWPDAKAFSDAHTFIGNLSLAGIPMPEISLADDGEINFFWNDDGVHVDLGFYGTGTYSYFARGKRGYGIHDDDVPASKGLPAEIFALFKA